jgi:hypothetical protein
MDQRASKVLKKFESLAAIPDWLLLARSGHTPRHPGRLVLTVEVRVQLVG